MKTIIIFFSAIFAFSLSSEDKTEGKEDYIIAKGQMPNLAKDKNSVLHLVFGIGDSIMYAFSTNNGSSFSKPSLVSSVPEAYSFAMRGPQIACANNSVIISG